MRIAMLAWEFPPLVVGGLAAHVDGLSRALARAGHEVVVLTLHHPDVPDDYEVEGVRVLRAHADLPWLPPEGMLAQMASANHKLVQLTARLGGWRPDLVHAHDWLVAWGGDTLRALWERPLVATIHATEKGRHGGNVPPGEPAGIHAVEWWLTYQASRVIACSAYMEAEVISTFDLPPSKVDAVPNGVDAPAWGPPPGAPARGSQGPLVVAWGRIQYEKGFQTLVLAVPALRDTVPGLKVVVAGRGSYLAELQSLAQRIGVEPVVQFAGFVPDAELQRLLHTATAVVIPSLYEPFGIVALEALAAGAPLIAADTGGMGEVLRGTDAGLLYPPGDPVALADALQRMLTEPGLAERSQAAGRELVTGRYSWDTVAGATARVYERVLAPAELAPRRV